MLILVHVLIALASMAWITRLYQSPSARRFHLPYGLIAATLISGACLVISTGSPLLSSCATGLVYLGIASAGVLAAHKKPGVR
jgi:hypothetical protein